MFQSENTASSLTMQRYVAKKIENAKTLFKQTLPIDS